MLANVITAEFFSVIVLSVLVGISLTVHVKLLTELMKKDDELLRRGLEIDRLKRGDFTNEEIQNLCHNLSPLDREAFEQGCRMYQNKLFGPKH